MAKHLLMISFDAVGDQDIAILQELPNFSRLMRRGTIVREVSSVFVSNTYPAHTTIQTGVYPVTHGVFDNTCRTDKSDREIWRFKASNIRVPSLIGEAARAGISICSVLYPVSGGAKIRWHFPEIAGDLPAIRRALRTIYYGNPFFVLASLFRFGHYLKNISPESLDRFTVSIAARAIAKHNPGLTMVHLLDADGTKHFDGPDTPEADAAIRRLDERLGELLDAVEKTGCAEDYSILIFSDHNCLPVATTLDTDALLRASGVANDAAYIHNAGGSCFLRITDTADTENREKIASFLRDFSANPGIERRLTAEEMRVSGAEGVYAEGFVAANGFSFGEKLRGQHGYTTDRDRYHTFYLAAGPGVPEDRTIRGGHLTDICPLAVDLLGLTPWPTDGANQVTSRP